MSLMSDIHFWGAHEEVDLKDTDYSTKKYVLRKSDNDSLNLISKRTYFEQRGLVWTPLNKRPVKLKDKLRELEELLYQNKVVGSSWNENKLILLLSRGVLVNITVNTKSSDVESVTFDRTLCSKVQNELICNAVLTSNQTIFTTTDGRTLGHGPSWREPWVLETGTRKNLTNQGEFLAVWGKTSSEHPQPWSPMAKDHQRANIHLYWVGARGPDLITHKKTDGEPFALVLSQRGPKTLSIVEQKVSARGNVAVELSVYEIQQNHNLKRATVTAVPLQTQLSCCAFSEDEVRLLLGCIDGTVAILNRNGSSTKTIKINFIPTLATFNSTGLLACLANEKGQIQYLDYSLNYINTKNNSEESNSANLNISTYFSTQPNIDAIIWSNLDLIVVLEHGPIMLIKQEEEPQKLVLLIERYLKANKINNAINVLLASDWNESCFIGLQRIVNFLMKLPMTEENAQHIQRVLGCFHSPEVPLTTEIRHRYGVSAKMMTRRFFHQLVRNGMYETAFLLAVDLGQHDLFMDLYYIAVNIGETEMAAAARAQASALLSRCSSEASICSRSSCSQCSDSSSSCEEGCSSPEHTQNTQNNQENYLTTSFNTLLPKTSGSYHGYIPPVPNVDLHKSAVRNAGKISTQNTYVQNSNTYNTTNTLNTNNYNIANAQNTTHNTNKNITQNNYNTLKMPQVIPVPTPVVPELLQLGIPTVAAKNVQFGNTANSKKSNANCYPLLDVKSYIPPLPTMSNSQSYMSNTSSSVNFMSNNHDMLNKQGKNDSFLLNMSSLTSMTATSNLIGITNTSNLTGMTNLAAMSNLTSMTGVSNLTSMTGTLNLTGMSKSTSNLIGNANVSSLTGVTNASNLAGVTYASNLTGMSKSSLNLTSSANVSSLTGVTNASSLTDKSHLTSMTDKNFANTSNLTSMSKSTSNLTAMTDMSNLTGMTNLSNNQGFSSNKQSFLTNEGNSTITSFLTSKLLKQSSSARNDRYLSNASNKYASSFASSSRNEGYLSDMPNTDILHFNNESMSDMSKNEAVLTKNQSFLTDMSTYQTGGSKNQSFSANLSNSQSTSSKNYSFASNNDCSMSNNQSFSLNQNFASKNQSVVPKCQSFASTNASKTQNSNHQNFISNDQNFSSNHQSSPSNQSLTSNISTFLNENQSFNTNVAPNYHNFASSSNLAMNPQNYIQIPSNSTQNLSNQNPNNQNSMYLPNNYSFPPNSSSNNFNYPVFEPNNASFNSATNQNQVNSKKPQAKVKFSDTVTAFIVPEVKRPVRPPLPAHLMDPQKELADSLPLCSPNEDYLKDFTPVQKNDGDRENSVQPKIKVVHFGVV